MDRHDEDDSRASLLLGFWKEAWEAFEKKGGLWENPGWLLQGEELMGKLVRYQRYPLWHVGETLRDDNVRTCCRVYHTPSSPGEWVYQDEEAVNPVLDFFMGIPTSLQTPIANAFLLAPIRWLAEDCWPKQEWYRQTTPENILEALRTLASLEEGHDFFGTLSFLLKQDLVFNGCLTCLNATQLPSYLKSFQRLYDRLKEERFALGLRKEASTAFLQVFIGRHASLIPEALEEIEKSPSLVDILNNLGHFPEELLKKWREGKNLREFWAFLRDPRLQEWKDTLLPPAERETFLSWILPTLMEKEEANFGDSLAMVVSLMEITSVEKEREFEVYMLRSLVALSLKTLSNMYSLLTRQDDGPSWLAIGGAKRGRQVLVLLSCAPSEPEREEALAFLNRPYREREILAHLPLQELSKWVYPQHAIREENKEVDDDERV